MSETENSKQGNSIEFGGTGNSSISASIEVKPAVVEKKGPKFLNLQQTLAKKAHEDA